MSDEDELLISIKVNGNPHSRHHVHSPFYLMATQGDEDPYFEGQQVFEGVFLHEMKSDFIVPSGARCLVLYGHAFSLFQLGGDFPPKFLSCKARRRRGFPA